MNELTLQTLTSSKENTYYKIVLTFAVLGWLPIVLPLPSAATKGLSLL